MKFIHVADIHLGARPEAGEAYSTNRKREIEDTFKAVLEQCERKKVDLLIIAGALFHQQPLLRELKEIDYFFSKLTVTKVVFLVGNSDELNEKSYYTSYRWSKNVFPILSKEMSCVQIHALGVAIYGCGYHQKEVDERKLETVMNRTHQPFHILVSHGGDEKHTPFRAEALKRMPYDYIALGHQHGPQIIVDRKMAYAGALEPIRVEDTGKHGYFYGEMREGEPGNQVVELAFIEFAKREYIYLEVDVEADMTNEMLKEKLFDLRKELGMQHMYLITLKGGHNPDIALDLDEMDSVGNIIDITNYTYPSYNLTELEAVNRDNLLGAYIDSFGKVEEGSIEYMALYAGVEAIERTKKG